MTAPRKKTLTPTQVGWLAQITAEGITQHKLLDLRTYCPSHFLALPRSLDSAVEAHNKGLANNSPLPASATIEPAQVGPRGGWGYRLVSEPLVDGARKSLEKTNAERLFEGKVSDARWCRAWAQINARVRKGETDSAIDSARQLVRAWRKYKKTKTAVALTHPYKLISDALVTLVAQSPLVTHVGIVGDRTIAQLREQAAKGEGT